MLLDRHKYTNTKKQKTNAHTTNLIQNYSETKFNDILNCHAEKNIILNNLQHFIDLIILQYLNFFY